MAGGETDLTKLPPKTEHDDLLSNLPDPKTLPAWLSAADLDFYAGEFSRSGMRGSSRVTKCTSRTLARTP